MRPVNLRVPHADLPALAQVLLPPSPSSISRSRSRSLSHSLSLFLSPSLSLPPSLGQVLLSGNMSNVNDLELWIMFYDCQYGHCVYFNNKMFEISPTQFLEFKTRIS